MSKYKQGEVLATSYDIWISGTKMGMDKKQCINSIEVKETVEGSDTATIQISDPEFLYLEDNIFLEDNTIKIKMYWSGTTFSLEFNGYISTIDIVFGEDGMPILTLTCMDKTHKMNRKKKNKTFKNTTSASVVKKIVKSYGFTCKIDSDYKFAVQETITQSGQTDIEFITKLASSETYPITARLVGKKFHYVKMGKLTTPKLTLTYRNYPHEIISFNPKINKETKKEEIKKSTVNTGNKKVSNAKGTAPTETGSASAEKTKNNSVSGKSGKSYTYNPKTKIWSKK